MQPHHHVIEPSGVLNSVGGDRLRANVSDALAAGASTIVINCQAVSFMDSNGFGALVSCLKKVRETGGTLALCAPSSQMRLVLEITGTDHVFKIYEKLADVDP
jgi:anti-sigma B factor antagonist